MQDLLNQAVEQSTANTMAVWFLIGAALVFFMQCGFAMVETGFTRAKNAGNIIMKNLMDFCIGTVVFCLLGFTIMMSEDYVMGLIGAPNMGIFTSWDNFDFSSFYFNLVFCATTATIVSGAMAERTKFVTYCIYSAVISAIVYPIEAGWIWNSNGWLAQMGYIDFAGSSCIHMVGGIASLIGAAMLGPRIGKYTKDKETGKITVNTIPGHSVTLGALGVFILWFAWYGFNGAAASDPSDLAKILVTTTIAPALATVSCMIFTWVKNGKPDVSMCLNASLAGLVAITAPCDVVDAVGAAIIGIVAGILVDLAVEFIDKVLHVDDPVGAIAVHGANGMWGALSVGLFSRAEGQEGIFYGGGFHQFGIQILGVLCVAVYSAICMLILFWILKKTVGLRVSADEEIEGLDITEHGLASAYGDFLTTVPTYINADTDGPVNVKNIKPVALDNAGAKPGAFTKVSIICNEDKFGVLKETMNAIGVTGMTVSNVMGCGAQMGKVGHYRGVKMNVALIPKVKVDIVVSEVDPALVVAAAEKAVYTGNPGDGKIFISSVNDAFRVRTGEHGQAAV